MNKDKFLKRNFHFSKLPFDYNGKKIQLKVVSATQVIGEDNQFYDAIDVGCESPDGYPTKTMTVRISGEMFRMLNCEQSVIECEEADN